MGGQGLNPLSLGGSENVGAEENESTVTESLDYDGLTPDYRLARWAFSEESSNQTSMSTSYTTVLRLSGAVDLGDIPTNATLYGRLIMVLSNDGSNETFAQPIMRTGGNNTSLTELEVSATGTDNERVDSGWVEITSNVSGIEEQVRIEGKVDAGTGTWFHRPIMFELVGVESVA